MEDWLVQVLVKLFINIGLILLAVRLFAYMIDRKIAMTKSIAESVVDGVDIKKAVGLFIVKMIPTGKKWLDQKLLGAGPNPPQQ